MSYSPQQLEKFATELQKLRNETVGVQMILYDLSQRLANSRAKTYANEGVGRRLPLIGKSAQNIFRLYPPGTCELLKRDDCEDIAIQLHAFAINVYAIFDNIAWVCMLEAGGTLSPMKVGLFKAECEQFLPAELKEYVGHETAKTWFKDYGKAYRDSTAHRIPPYLPSRAYTPEESRRFLDLHNQAQQILIEASQAMANDRVRGRELLDTHETLVQGKEQIGSNSLLVAISLNGDDTSPPIYLHPQLLCDWGLANEVVRTFDRSMRTHYGWPIVPIPEVEVR